MEKKFFKELKALYSFAEKEMETCPWINDLTLEELLLHIKSELNEFEKELKEKNREEMAKEAGDIFRDVLLLLFLLEREEGIAKEEVLKKIMNKLMWRKPWVLKGERITKEEAIRIWEERKNQE